MVITTDLPPANFHWGWHPDTIHGSLAVSTPEHLACDVERKRHCQGQPSRDWDRRVGSLLHVRKLNVDTSPKSTVAVGSAGVPWPSPHHVCTVAQEGCASLRNSSGPSPRPGRLSGAVSRFSALPCVSFPTGAPTHSCGSNAEFKSLGLGLSCPQFKRLQEPFWQKKATQPSSQ